MAAVLEYPWYTAAVVSDNVGHSRYQGLAIHQGPGQLVPALTEAVSPLAQLVGDQLGLSLEAAGGRGLGDAVAAVADVGAGGGEGAAVEVEGGGQVYEELTRARARPGPVSCICTPTQAWFSSLKLSLRCARFVPLSPKSDPIACICAPRG